MMRWGLVVIIGVTLAGCGQSGDLFLPPEDAPETVTGPDTPEPTNEAEQDDDEKTPAG